MTPGTDDNARARVPEHGASTRSSREEQPAFLESFPDSPELQPLVEAFLRGDYASLRKDAPRVAQHAKDATVRDAALELSNRIRPDPMVRYVLGATTILLLVLIFWTYGGHTH